MGFREKFDTLRQQCTRKKDISKAGSGDLGDELSLKKLLTTRDLVSLGVGSCNGTGMYVVAGLIAKRLAGPGVVISFIIAGLASLLSGICYAEFGVRVPKTSGSAYTYSYVTVGEFVAFFIGWNLILEYLIGTASGASALSSMIDSLTNRSISEWSIKNLGQMRQPWEGADENGYPDLLAMFICIVMVVIVGAGLKNSMMLNNVLNIANLLVWGGIIVGGLFEIEPANWSLSAADWNPEGRNLTEKEIRLYGDGGFLPYGWEGVIRGAATAFYAYIGFDIIATTGEECKKPHKSIPKAIVYSLFICLLCYSTTSIMLTLTDRYYDIDSEAPLTEMFDRCAGNTCHEFLKKAKYFISIGSFCALTASLLGSLFPMPRIIYAMSSDGLLFNFLSHIFPPTGTPLIATVITGVFASVLALIVSLRDLIEMMSIGTLLAYTLVAISVLILRYQPTVTVDTGMADEDDTDDLPDVSDKYKIAHNLPNIQRDNANRAFDMDDKAILIEDQTTNYGTLGNANQEPVLTDKATWFGALFDKCMPAVVWTQIALGLPKVTDNPTEASGKQAVNAISRFVFYCFVYNILQVIKIFNSTVRWIVFIPSSCVLLYFMLRIWQLPPNRTKLPFMVPFVPILPLVAIMANIFLMCRLSVVTWVRFIIWCFIGAVIYFGYGIKFSNLELRMGQKATYKVGLDLDSDFDPNFAKTSNTKGGYQNFENEAE